MKLVETFSKRSYERPEARILTIHSPKLLSAFSPTESELDEWDEVGDLSDIENSLNRS